MISIKDLVWDALYKFRRTGPSPRRAFWTVGDAGFAAVVLSNVNRVLLEGVPTAEGRVRLSDAAGAILMLVANVKTGSVDYTGGRLAPANMAEYFECSLKTMQNGVRELTDLQLVTKVFEGRELITLDLAVWLLNHERPRGSSAPSYSQAKIFSSIDDGSSSERNFLRGAYKDLHIKESVDDSPFPPRTPNGNGQKETPRARPTLILDGSPDASTDGGRGSARSTNDDRTATTTAQGIDDIAAKRQRFLDEHRAWREGGGQLPKAEGRSPIVEDDAARPPPT